MNFTREISTDEYLGTFKQSTERGEKRERVLSLVDKLYRDKSISVDVWSAFGTLRNLYFFDLPASEGVSSYGQSVRASQAITKADRAGRRHTGYAIGPDGEFQYAGGRKSRRNAHDLADAVFAACGVVDSEGIKRADPMHVDILIRVCTETESPPTLTAITQELRGPYRGEKQMPPFALGILTVWGERLFLHLRETGKA